MHYALVLIALGGLLVLHELGHLVAARLLGVRVPRFVVGFGPPLVSFRLGGTQFVMGAVPLGATVHIQGMNPHRSEAVDAASFSTLGPLRRMAIILAGPLANYLLALGILFALYTSGTHVVVPLTVGTVQPGSEAARAQLLPGDRIVRVDGQSLRTWSEFVDKVAQAPGRSLELAVERGSEARTVTVKPRPDERGAGRIGVSQQYVFRAHAAGEALARSFSHTGAVAAEGLAMLVDVVRGTERGGSSGPGALVRQESSDAASSGGDAMLRALVAVTVALAMLTMVPVPGLDGGRVLLLAVEAVSGRRIPARIETVAQTVGFLAIAVAIVGIAAAEIRRAMPVPPAPVPGVPVATAASDGGTPGEGPGSAGVAAVPTAPVGTAPGPVPPTSGTQVVTAPVSAPSTPVAPAPGGAAAATTPADAGAPTPLSIPATGSTTPTSTAAASPGAGATPAPKSGASTANPTASAPSPANAVPATGTPSNDAGNVRPAAVSVPASPPGSAVPRSNQAGIPPSAGGPSPPDEGAATR